MNHSLTKKLEPRRLQRKIHQAGKAVAVVPLRVLCGLSFATFAVKSFLPQALEFSHYAPIIAANTQPRE